MTTTDQPQWCGLRVAPSRTMTRRSKRSRIGSLIRRTKRGQAPNGLMRRRADRPGSEGHDRGVRQGGHDEDLATTSRVTGIISEAGRTDLYSVATSRLGVGLPERVVHMSV